jgi:hypothetical protein
MGGYTNTSLTAIQQVSAEYIKDQITHIAVGDSATEFSPTQTELSNEVFRKAVDSITRTGSEVRSRVRLDVTEANSNTLRETGQFDSSSAGVMISRNFLTPFEKTSNKELTIINRAIFEAKNK